MYNDPNVRYNSIPLQHYQTNNQPTYYQAPIYMGQSMAPLPKIDSSNANQMGNLNPYETKSNHNGNPY